MPKMKIISPMKAIFKSVILFALISLFWISLFWLTLVYFIPPDIVCPTNDIIQKSFYCNLYNKNWYLNSAYNSLNNYANELESNISLLHSEIDPLKNKTVNLEMMVNECKSNLIVADKRRMELERVNITNFEIISNLSNLSNKCLDQIICCDELKKHMSEDNWGYFIRNKASINITEININPSINLFCVSL